MTARERLRTIANRCAGAGLLGLEDKSIAMSDAHDLRALADRLDAEMAAIEMHSRTDAVAEAYKNVVRGVVARLDAPLDADPNTTTQNQAGEPKP